MSRSAPSESLAILGPLRATGPDGLVRLRPAQRRVLSILLLEPDGELPRDVLIDRMWGEAAPGTASTSLQVHISGLRRSLPGLVATTPRGYRVTIAGRRFDRVQFEALAERALSAARPGDWPAALESASRALGLWRGVPFDELRHDDFAAPEINRLVERWIDMQELQARALLGLNRLEEAIGRLSDIVARHPLREPLWEQLMLALYRSGRRGEALRTFQRLRQILAEELDIEPSPALARLQERMLAADPALGEPDHAPEAAPLPALSTTFVGREDELHGLAELLTRERLVTIVGGPGFGKTRLAVETGRMLHDAWPGAVWFVSLAEARSPSEVVGAIASATRLREHGRTVADVVRRLAPRSALLVLDNCEHQLATCAELVTQALAAGPGLRFLLTSRQPLGIVGEHLWRIEPLTAPSARTSATSLAPISASPAVQLFADRARAVDRAFALTPQTAPKVAELCRRAAGIPLAIELAARWVPALGLDDIGEMLSGEPPGGALSLLDHHRSLTAAIEWSVALLPPEDRRLFILASVFNGRFGFEDVRAVCARDQEPRRLARAVAGLAQASLIGVERQPDGTALYRMLAPIRELAGERAPALPDWSTAQERFVDHYLNKVYGDSRDPLRQVVDLERVDRDIDNLRHAFELGLQLGRADDVARLLVRLDGYTLNRYLVAERKSWLERAVERVSDTLTRAHVLRSLGSAAQVLGEIDESLAYLEQALTVFRRANDAAGLAQCLLSLSGLLAMRGDWSAGLEAAREARVIAADVHSTSGLAVAAYYIGENLAYGGDVTGALPELEQAARLFEKSGELGRASYALSTLASVAALAGDETRARRAAPRALALAEQSQSVYRRVRALGAAALIEARYGTAELARVALLEVNRLMEPYESDTVQLFMLPSAVLLQRWGNRRMLAEVLLGVEAAISGQGVGYPQPWRRAVEELKLATDTEPSPPADDVLPLPLAPRTLEQISADLLTELKQSRAPTTAAGGAPATV